MRQLAVSWACGHGYAFFPARRAGDSRGFAVKVGSGRTVGLPHRERHDLRLLALLVFGCHFVLRSCGEGGGCDRGLRPDALAGS